MKLNLRGKVMLLSLLALLTFSLSGAAAPASYVHSVWSEKHIKLHVPYETAYEVKEGKAIASWRHASIITDADEARAFYDAIVQANGDRYEIRLVKTGSTTADEIFGLFNIYKNNVRVAQVEGVVRHLSNPVGERYAFESLDQSWYLAGYITDRMDF